MACRGVHFALSAGEQQRLLAAAGDDDAVLSVILEDIEQRWDNDWLQETDKAWDAIHRCLTDGTLSFESISPFHKCILGGRQLYNALSDEDFGYTWGWFEPLKEFFARAAHARRSVVFTVDQ
jgi:hypothetical protein